MRAAASTTWRPNRSPGCRDKRSTGPLMLTAATRSPCADRTGALTDATPARAPRRSPPIPVDRSRPTARDRLTRARAGAARPSGTIQRRAWGDGSDSTHRRCVPSRTNNCTLSPVSSRSRVSAGRANSTSGKRSSAIRPRAASSGPRSKRPSSSRRSSPCASRATASRWAVARGRPVADWRRAEGGGPVGDDAAGCRSPCRARRHPLQCPYRRNNIPDHEILPDLRRRQSGHPTRGHPR